MVYENFYNNAPKEKINEYFKYSVNRIYAILGMYEDENDFKNLHCYLRRLIIEFKGIIDLYDGKEFISLINILNGIDNNLESLNHSEIKSLVFHCISLLKKIKGENNVL